MYSHALGRYAKKCDHGFTLVEIMVVVGIFGILMAFVIANLQTSKSKSRDQRRVADVQQLQLALETFFEKNHYYPQSISALQGEYIAEVPTPPTGAGQTSYAYAATGSILNRCSGYHLGADLETEVPPLQEDDDPTVLRGTSCAPSGAADFAGGYTLCGLVVGSPEKCYDVIEQ